jgi:hypothetical protein
LARAHDVSNKNVMMLELENIKKGNDISNVDEPNENVESSEMQHINRVRVVTNLSPKKLPMHFWRRK